METSVQITLRGMAHSDTLNEHIRGEASKLEKFCDRMISCHVVVDKPHKHHRANQFTVRLDISIPRNELVINREHEDVHAALHDAFQAAARQLKELKQDHKRQSRETVASRGISATPTEN